MFDYFISLGSACPMAASMSKYGLRSFSGVFDWLITSNFEYVLHYIETDFKDFLLLQNLERYDGYINHFRDKKSDVRFTHDVENFETEYENLRAKYERRINRFLKNIKHRVCYLRYVQSEKELKYIKENSAYIKYVVQKHNSDSEIVFLYNDGLEVLDSIEFQSFKMSSEWSGASWSEVRSFFDEAYEFLTFCSSNYLALCLMQNIMFDSKKEDSAQKVIERRYRTLGALLSYDFSNDTILRVGGGWNSLFMVQELSEKNCIKK